MDNEQHKADAFETFVWLGAAAFCLVFWAMVVAALI